MDLPLIIALSAIFGLPIVIVVGAALFPPEPLNDPLEYMSNWGSQDTDQRNLNK
jgi:hypothetical protein